MNGEIQRGDSGVMFCWNRPDSTERAVLLSPWAYSGLAPEHYAHDIC